MRLITCLIVITSSIVLLSGCNTPGYHRDAVSAGHQQTMTVGTVQREIREGMSQDEVARVLGSPNVVTRVGKVEETWIYDKFSTETVYSKDSGGMTVLLLGYGANGGGGAAPGYQSGSGASASSQKTLTVIIRFHEGRVYDFSYHASRF